MNNKNSFSLLIVILINILLALALVDTVQGVNGSEGASCFVNSTQQEGICTKFTKCEKQCAPKDVNFERCKHTPRGREPIVCCPKERPTNSISAKKCLEYKELACDINYFSGALDESPMKLKTSNCATNVKAVIMNGENAEQREFPHMALLVYVYNGAEHFGCGGTLISDRFVLTAAHCFHHETYGKVQHVRLGEHDYSNTNNDARIEVKIEKNIPYPNYEIPFSYNDIGLLKLAQSVHFTSAIRPACLPEEPITVSNATATGWGLVDNLNESNVLMKVNLALLDNNKCQASDRPYPQGMNETTQFCAGSHTHANNTCKGDSGGPLQIIHEHHFCTFSIIGVTSFGNPCNSERNYSSGIYTRVFPYLDWIERVVWEGEQIASK